MQVVPPAAGDDGDDDGRPGTHGSVIDRRRKVPTAPARHSVVTRPPLDPLVLCDIERLLATFQANGCSGFSDEALVALSEGCKQLSLIDVRGCSRVTEHGLASCARLLPKCKVMANTHALQVS